MASSVVKALDAIVSIQKTKKATVYTASRDNAKGWPNQCRLSGSTIANTSISITPASKKAGQCPLACLAQSGATYSVPALSAANAAVTPAP